MNDFKRSLITLIETKVFKRTLVTHWWTDYSVVFWNSISWKWLSWSFHEHFYEIRGIFKIYWLFQSVRVYPKSQSIVWWSSLTIWVGIPYDNKCPKLVKQQCLEGACRHDCHSQPRIEPISLKIFLGDS